LVFAERRNVTLYEDIINLPHHVSATRPQMSMMDRAAQFSPFAALTGYDAAIKESGRLTDEKIEMDADALNILNAKFQMLRNHLKENPEVTFTCFRPDERKAGGAYITVTGTVKKMNDFERLIVMQNGTKMPMDDILDIEGDIFASLQ
jgi:hypothetical protein